VLFVSSDTSLREEPLQSRDLLKLFICEQCSKTLLILEELVFTTIFVPWRSRNKLIGLEYFSKGIPPTWEFRLRTAAGLIQRGTHGSGSIQMDEPHSSTFSLFLINI
jgi:hypothetical protein